MSWAFSEAKLDTYQMLSNLPVMQAKPANLQNSSFLELSPHQFCGETLSEEQASVSQQEFENVAAISRKIVILLWAADIG